MTEAAELEARARVGRKLGDRWTLERLLGTDTTSATYAARHDIGRLEAIKLLHPHLARSDYRQRFEDEARIANRFRHRAAVAVRDVDVTEEGLPFLVMELVEGKPLAEHFAEDPSVDALLDSMDELLDVLAAAHEAGTVHGDVQPARLIVEPTGQLRLLDFGLARADATTSGPAADLRGVAATMRELLATTGQSHEGVGRIAERALGTGAPFSNARDMQQALRALREHRAPRTTEPDTKRIATEGGGDTLVSPSIPLARPSRRPLAALIAGGALLLPALYLNLAMLRVVLQAEGRQAGWTIVAVGWMLTLAPLFAAVALLRWGWRRR